MLPAFDNLDRRIAYYKLLLERDLVNLPADPLPAGFHFVFYQPGDRDSWIEIEKSAKEFKNYAEGLAAWNRYYADHEQELPRRMLFLANESGEKIATATAFYDTAGGDTPAGGWLHWVAVKRPYQGQGLAKPLIAHALKLLKNLGYTHAYIPTQTTTWLACKIYLDFGFLPTAENAVESETGWRIIRRLTSHPALAAFAPADNERVLGHGK